MEPACSPATLEDSRYSNVQLGLALWGNVVRALTADLGHTLIEGWMLGMQVALWLLDEEEWDQIDWTPDATGISRTLDAWAEDGRRAVREIQEELTMRRIRRRRVHSRP